MYGSPSRDRKSEGEVVDEHGEISMDEQKVWSNTFARPANRGMILLYTMT